MKNKVIGLILTISMISTLTACGGAVPTATAEAPANAETIADATTNEATEAVAEVLCKDGHTWVEATCTEPKTCSVCGATEGEALGHEWLENTPNYQQAKTCSRCNETEGDPLEAEFAKKGFAVETDWDKEYTMTVPCYNDKSKTTVGKCSFTNLRRVVSDDALGLEAADGYEWLIFDHIDKYDDENAVEYGFLGIACAGMDYYDTYNVGNSDLGTDFEPGKTDLKTVDRFSVNWNGEDYPDCMFLWGEGTGGWNKEDRTCIDTYTVYIRVPIGYDGIIISLIPLGTDVIDKYDAGEKVIDCLDDTCVNFRVITK